MSDRPPALRLALILAALYVTRASACTDLREVAPMTDPSESAVRAAMLMSTAMNLAPVLDDPAALQGVDRDDLRSTLLQTAEELDWFGAIAGDTAGASWPFDARDRVERLRALASAWDPSVAPPQALLEAARACFAMIHPLATTP